MRLIAELEALTIKAVTSESVARQPPKFLANLPMEGCEVTTTDERNRLVRQLSAEVIIENRTVVAVKPRPERLPFFESVSCCVSGSVGDRFFEIDVVTLPLIPLLYPGQLLHLGH